MGQLENNKKRNHTEIINQTKHLLIVGLITKIKTMALNIYMQRNKNQIII